MQQGFEGFPTKLRIHPRSLAGRCTTPQFIKEVLEERDVDISHFFWRFQLGEYCEALTVRREVVIHHDSEVMKLLIGPKARFAGDERSALHFIIHHHDLVVEILKE